jgi:hypothetical protein
VAASLQITVAGFYHHRQRHDDGRGRIEIVGIALGSGKRLYARKKLLTIDGFGEKVIGARLPPFDATLPIGQCRDHDDGGQPRGRVELQAPTQCKSVAAGEDNVQEDDVGILAGNGSDRGIDVSRRINSVALFCEQAFEQTGVGRLIVDDKHPRCIDSIRHDLRITSCCSLTRSTAHARRSEES